MKETLNVSISGIRFIINSDAYRILRAYLDKIEATYAKEADGKEIIADIEARIAELLLSKQSDTTKVIHREFVEDVVSRLGEPEEVNSETTEKSEPLEQNQRFERRLYRWSDGALLGGVLNGLSAYFNIDVTALRILFVLFFALGCWVSGTLNATLCLAYMVMWIIVPRAKTARQKMEMRGDPVTASSIENSIKEEINSVYKNPKNARVASVFSTILFIIGRIIKGIILCIAALVGITFLCLILAAFVGFVYLLTDLPLVEMCVDTNPYIALSIALVAVSVPLLFVVYLIIKTLLNIKWKRSLIVVLFSLWAVSWLVAAVLFAKEVSRFRENYFEIKTTTIVNSASALYVNASTDAALFMENVLSDQCDVFYYCEADTLLTDNEYRIEVERSADGRNKSEARQRVSRIEYPLEIVTDSILIVNPKIRFNGAGDVFANQRIQVTIFHPKGRNVIVSEELRSYNNCLNLFEEDNY